MKLPLSSKEARDNNLDINKYKVNIFWEIKMKKIIQTFCFVGLLAIPVAGAAVETLDGDNNVVTNSVDGGGPGFTFDVSPSVEISFLSTASAYAIMSANTLTDTTNGVEYGTRHDSTGYAMRKKTTDAKIGPAPVTSATALPVDADETWTWMS